MVKVEVNIWPLVLSRNQHVEAPLTHLRIPDGNASIFRIHFAFHHVLSLLLLHSWPRSWYHSHRRRREYCALHLYDRLVSIMDLH